MPMDQRPSFSSSPGSSFWNHQEPTMDPPGSQRKRPSSATTRPKPMSPHHGLFASLGVDEPTERSTTASSGNGTATLTRPAPAPAAAAFFGGGNKKDSSLFGMDDAEGLFDGDDGWGCDSPSAILSGGSQAEEKTFEDDLGDDLTEKLEDRSSTTPSASTATAALVDSEPTHAMFAPPSSQTSSAMGSFVTAPGLQASSSWSTKSAATNAFMDNTGNDWNDVAAVEAANEEPSNAWDADWEDDEALDLNPMHSETREMKPPSLHETMGSGNQSHVFHSSNPGGSAAGTALGMDYDFDEAEGDAWPDENLISSPKNEGEVMTYEPEEEIHAFSSTSVRPTESKAAVEYREAMTERSHEQQHHPFSTGHTASSHSTTPGNDTTLHTQPQELDSGLPSTDSWSTSSDWPTKVQSDFDLPSATDDMVAPDANENWQWGEDDLAVSSDDGEKEPEKAEDHDFLVESHPFSSPEAAFEKEASAAFQPHETTEYPSQLGEINDSKSPTGQASFVGTMQAAEPSFAYENGESRTDSQDWFGSTVSDATETFGNSANLSSFSEPAEADAAAYVEGPPQEPIDTNQSTSAGQQEGLTQNAERTSSEQPSESVEEHSWPNESSGTNSFSKYDHESGRQQPYQQNSSHQSKPDDFGTNRGGHVNTDSHEESGITDEAHVVQKGEGEWSEWSEQEESQQTPSEKEYPWDSTGLSRPGEWNNGAAEYGNFANESNAFERGSMASFGGDVSSVAATAGESDAASDTLFSDAGTSETAPSLFASSAASSVYNPSVGGSTMSMTEDFSNETNSLAFESGTPAQDYTYDQSVNNEDIPSASAASGENQESSNSPFDTSSTGNDAFSTITDNQKPGFATDLKTIAEHSSAPSFTPSADSLFSSEPPQSSNHQPLNEFQTSGSQEETGQETSAGDVSSLFGSAPPTSGFGATQYQNEFSQSFDSQYGQEAHFGQSSTEQQDEPFGPSSTGVSDANEVFGGSSHSFGAGLGVTGNPFAQGQSPSSSLFDGPSKTPPDEFNYDTHQNQAYGDFSESNSYEQVQHDSDAFAFGHAGGEHDFPAEQYGGDHTFSNTSNRALNQDGKAPNDHVPESLPFDNHEEYPSPPLAQDFFGSSGQMGATDFFGHQETQSSDNFFSDSQAHESSTTAFDNGVSGERGHESFAAAESQVQDTGLENAHSESREDFDAHVSTLRPSYDGSVIDEKPTDDIGKARHPHEQTPHVLEHEKAVSTVTEGSYRVEESDLTTDVVDKQSQSAQPTGVDANVDSGMQWEDGDWSSSDLPPTNGPKVGGDVFDATGTTHSIPEPLQPANTADTQDQSSADPNFPIHADDRGTTTDLFATSASDAFGSSIPEFSDSDPFVAARKSSEDFFNHVHPSEHSSSSHAHGFESFAPQDEGIHPQPGGSSFENPGVMPSFQHEPHVSAEQNFYGESAGTHYGDFNAPKTPSQTYGNPEFGQGHESSQDFVNFGGDNSQYANQYQQQYEADPFQQSEGKLQEDPFQTDPNQGYGYVGGQYGESVASPTGHTVDQYGEGVASPMSHQDQNPQGYSYDQYAYEQYGYHDQQQYHSYGNNGQQAYTDAQNTQYGVYQGEVEGSVLTTQSKLKDPNQVPPSCLVSFGFGGTAITMFPRRKLRLNAASNIRSPRSTPGLPFEENNTGELRKGPVNVFRMEKIVANDESFSQIDNFPGPLSEDVNDATILQYIDEKIKHIIAKTTEDEDVRLLYGILGVLTKSNGRLRADAGTEPSDPKSPEVQLLALLHESDQRRRGGQRAVFPNPKPVNIHPDSVLKSSNRIRELLLVGDRKRAVEAAMHAQMWPEAMLIASFIDKDEYKRVLATFLNGHYVAGDPCRTLYLSFADQQDKSVEEPQKLMQTSEAAQPSTILSSWVTHVQVLLANRTADTNRILVGLGNRLWNENGAVIAAHICYLIAGYTVEAPSPSSKIALLGADHRTPAQARLYVSTDAVQRTEIYEWIQRRANGSSVNMIPFQGYKLIHAMVLADCGKLELAFKYVDSMLNVLKAVMANMKPGSSMYLEGMQNQLTVLDDRLRQHLGQDRVDNVSSSTGKQGKWGIGSALSIMGKIVNRVVEGNDAPPSASSSNGPGSNGKQSLFPGAPRSNSGSSQPAVQAPPRSSGGGGPPTPQFAPGYGNQAAQQGNDGMPTPFGSNTPAYHPSPPPPMPAASGPTAPSRTAPPAPMAPQQHYQPPPSHEAPPRSQGKSSQLYQGPTPMHQSLSPGFPESPAAPPMQTANPSFASPSHPSAFQKPSVDLSGDAGTKDFHPVRRTSEPKPSSPRGPVDQDKPLPSGPASDKGSASPKIKDTKKGGRSKTPPPSTSKISGGWLSGLSSFIATKMNPEAKVAKLGEEMEAYYDEKTKRWVFPGETAAEEPSIPSAPPTGPMPPLGGAANGPPGPGSAPASTTAGSKQDDDPLSALMAPPPSRVLMKKDPLAAMMAPPPRSNLYGSQRGGQPAAARKPPRPQYAVFKAPPRSATPAPAEEASQQPGE